MHEHKNAGATGFPLRPRPGSVGAAYTAMEAVFSAAWRLAISDESAAPIGFADTSVVEEMAQYILDAGKTSTADTLIAWLVEAGYRDAGDLTGCERIALRAFISVFIDIEDFAESMSSCA